MSECTAPIADEALIDYWFDRGTDDAHEAIEEHLFACSDCSARLAHLAAMRAGVAALAREGRLSGVVSRGVLNRLQRDGVRVRTYALAPGERVPCAIFPDDDLIVTALHADLSGVSAVSISVESSGDVLSHELHDVPVSTAEGAVVWAFPGSLVRTLPSTTLHITLRSAEPTPRLLGEYVLDHSGIDAHT